MPQLPEPVPAEVAQAAEQHRLGLPRDVFIVARKQGVFKATDVGNRVYAYEHGLVRKMVGQPLYAMRWEQFDTVEQTWVNHSTNRAYNGTTFRIVLRSRGGGSVSFDDRYKDPAHSMTDPQHNDCRYAMYLRANIEPIWQRQIQKSLHAVQRGEVLTFGPIRLDAAGIQTPKGELAWDQVEKVEVSDGYVVVDKKRRLWPAAMVPVAQVPDCTLLLTVARALREGWVAAPVRNPPPPPPRAPEPVHQVPRTSFRTPPPAHAPAAPVDPVARVRPVLADSEFPALPVMWSRWATIAAALVAIRSEVGPRISSATMATFEGSTGSGSTFRRLPRDRAVFSGGTIDHGPTQALAGAPEWITTSVLNSRTHDGRLNFCYWWDGGHWYRGQSLDAALLSNAMPGIWTDGTVADVVTGLVDHRPGDHSRQAVARLQSAAAHQAVTRAHLEEVFGGGNLDVDGAYNQFVLAELTAP
ncbi:DUF6585 family protein [Nocardia sp. NPDC127526]|uniref:DUF6585 family protein n=1 Tax=Nocardia sp. NPDC127526 TaxID=3345393 RepID=UPI00363BB34C